MTKGPPRHKKTWWWNEEVAEAVRNKKIKYGKWGNNGVGRMGKVQGAPSAGAPKFQAKK